MINYHKSSVIISKDSFSNNNTILESTNYSELPKDNVEINVTSLKDYIQLSDVLEDKSYIIVDNDNIYLVEGNIAVKV